MTNKSVYDRETKVAVKFIVSQLKGVVYNHGGMGNADKVDQVFYDIFGYKNLTKKLNNCYDDRDTIIVIGEIGFKHLMNICNNAKLLNAVNELIHIVRRTSSIKKEMKKLEKRGKKKDKDMIKEFEYIKELYKDSIKAIRKSLGIKKENSYKSRYSYLKDLSDRSHGGVFDDDDDFESRLLFDDDDDDFEDDEMDEFHKYQQYMMRKNGNYKKAAGPFTKRSSREDEDEDLADEDDDDEDASELDEKLEVLSDNMTTLSSSVQQLINYQMQSITTDKIRPVYESVDHRKAEDEESEAYRALRSLSRDEDGEEDAENLDDDEEPLEQCIHSLVSTVASINESQSGIITTLEDLSGRMDGIYTWIDAVTSEMEDEESEGMDDPSPNEMTTKDYLAQKEAELQEEASKVIVNKEKVDNLNQMTGEELIEKVNAKPVNQKKKATPHKEVEPDTGPGPSVPAMSVKAKPVVHSTK